MTWPLVRNVVHRDDDQRTEGSRPLFAVLAGALLTLAGTAAAGGGVPARADTRSRADVAVVAGGTDLVGFGSIVDGVLSLQVRSDVRGFVTLIVIDTAERGVIVEAFITADGRLTVLDDTDFVPLDAFLHPFGATGVSVTMVRSFEASDLASWAAGLSTLVEAEGASASARHDRASHGNLAAAIDLPPAPASPAFVGAATTSVGVDSAAASGGISVSLRVGLGTAP